MFAEVDLLSFIEECVDIPKFLECCRVCPNYNKRWACPPYSFSVEDVWKKYSSILLYAEKIYVPMEFANVAFPQDEINKISHRLIMPAKERMMHELLKLETGKPGSMALFAGSCEICPVCMKEQGLPCIHPDLMRHSIESLGGDVCKASELYFGEKILWAENGKLPEYYMLLGGLLQ